MGFVLLGKSARLSDVGGLGERLGGGFCEGLSHSSPHKLMRLWTFAALQARGRGEWEGME